MFWFWIFFFYSLAGSGLEKLYALVTHARHRVRKCFLLLPLCPVYGLAMAAVLYLAGDTESFWQLALYGGILCTAVEYAVHFYMKNAWVSCSVTTAAPIWISTAGFASPSPWPGGCCRLWRCGMCSPCWSLS